jgi:hypothetical protein
VSVEEEHGEEGKQPEGVEPLVRPTLGEVHTCLSAVTHLACRAGARARAG